MAIGDEPHITVNGQPLTTAQAMTVRVALGTYLIDMNNQGALGTDRTGEDIRAGYLTAGAEVMRLMVEVPASRGARVDIALAKRVGDMIAGKAKLKAGIVNWQRAYPLNVFPEPDHTKAAELLQAGGITLDAVSASAIRHTLSRVLELISQLEADN